MPGIQNKKVNKMGVWDEVKNDGKHAFYTILLLAAIVLLFLLWSFITGLFK